MDNTDRPIGKRHVGKSPVTADLDAHDGKKARVVVVSKKVLFEKS